MEAFPIIPFDVFLVQQSVKCCTWNFSCDEIIIEGKLKLRKIFRSNISLYKVIRKYNPLDKGSTGSNHRVYHLIIPFDLFVPLPPVKICKFIISFTTRERKIKFFHKRIIHQYHAKISKYYKIYISNNPSTLPIILPIIYLARY